MSELIWVEVSKEALTSNIKHFRKLIGDEKILCPCVKANAYGHGLIGSAKIFLEAGADWVAVNSLYEAVELRKAGVIKPIYILGYVGLNDLEEVVKLDLRLVVYNKETVDELAEVCEKLNKTVKVHLKAETGNNRQGLYIDDLVEFAKYIKKFEKIDIEGLSTHFANIEDTTDYSYAELQLKRFCEIIDTLEKNGIHIKIKHCANSAATILFPETYFDMVRPGISVYGMWPSSETYAFYLKEKGNGFALTPAFTWKTKIAQIKKVPKDEYVGYGCTFKTICETVLAILPVGYYDGYDRGISGGYVLIHGKKASITGRICMNIIMVDVTNIPEVKLEDDVVLIGKSGEEEITVEQFAKWASTINYEITTRVNERIPRFFI